MARENYGIKFGEQQMLIEHPAGSGIFTNPCGITGLTRNTTTNTADVNLPPCNDPDAVTWLGIDPISKRMTLTFTGTLAKNALQIWDSFSMESASRLVRWYRNLGTPNAGYWEGFAILTEYNEESSDRGRYTVSGTIIFDGEPEWVSVPPAPAIVTNVSVPVSPAPEVGEVFPSETGVFTGGGASTYQWFANDVLISGATSASYTPVTADIGKVLHVVQTSTNASGSINSKSNYSLAVLA